MPSDTIAAISSAVGPAARMIVRASGPLSRDICIHLVGSASADRLLACGSENNRPNEADPTIPYENAHGAAVGFQQDLKFQNLALPAWVYLFRAPHSATGEDVLELHIPGNPLLARMLLDELIRLGARPAEPGEFTARAFFNGRISLDEAEGVAATIAAHSERELAAARQLLAGELARRLKPIMDELAGTLALVEVGIDFSEEDVAFLSKGQISQRIDAALKSMQSLLEQSARFDRLSHEPQIVLVGRPNAGKSMLLNALAETHRAIVSPQVGTTRDILWACARLKRGIVRILDVAGIDEDESADVISSSMQSQAHRAIEQADVIVLVRDCTDSRDPIHISKRIDLLVESKADLPRKPALQGRVRQGETSIPVSALTNQNMQSLRDRLDELAFGKTSTGATLALNSRHVRAIEDARAALIRAQGLLDQSGAEVIAFELRESLDCLGQILGVVTPDEVLGRVFSTFCIGK